MITKRFMTLIGMIFVGFVFLGAFALNGQEDDECISCSKEFALDGCTVIMVGKEASTDGSVISTHTCDCGFCDWTFRYVPPADHKEGATRKIYHTNQFETWPPDTGLKWDKHHHQIKE